MITCDSTTAEFVNLVEQGVITPERLREAEAAAVARGIDVERVLLEFGLTRSALLHSLSAYYGWPSIEYDERIPVPTELLSAPDGEMLSLGQWFPVIRDGDTVVIAARNPSDPEVLEEARRFVHAERYEFRVALAEDIQWFIQDFLHAPPGRLIGTERTGLAHWRNTMAHWRTRLACYRNDLAKARTDLAFLRWGLGFIALSDTLMRIHKSGAVISLYWGMIAAGIGLVIFGLSGYLKIRKSRMGPPGHQTLVEVTAATLHFLEDYHFIEQSGIPAPVKKTMLGRLGDFLVAHSTILYPSPASRERTHLARERNVLASQRTVAACYRTLYARARTGLAFVRSGISFLSLGLGLMQYFGISVLTAFDSLLIVAGIGMTVDGALWYLPVRKEQSEIPRCPVPYEMTG